jgi:hypothetical protein
MPLCAVHLLPHETQETSWRTGYFSFLNEKLDQIESEISMVKIEDITNAIFQNKSEILGQMALGLIKQKHGDLLEQEYCDCPNCGKQTKAWNKKVKRKIESHGWKF